MNAISVLPIDNAEFKFAQRAWAFAQERRRDIDAHFTERLRSAPNMWNGRVLLLGDYSFNAGSICGTFFETDFASFLGWWDWDFPDRTVWNCFSMGAIRSADGAFLLGVMNQGTSRAGQIYFPAGIPDPTDIVGGKVDLAGNVLREVQEETGLSPRYFAVHPGWFAGQDGQIIALMRVMQTPDNAADVRERILAHLATEQSPELADIHIVRSRTDIHPIMPRYVTTFLEHMLEKRFDEPL